MNIAVIGPGAIGSLIIYALNNAGITPDVYVRNEISLKRIKDNKGIKIVVNGIIKELKGNINLIDDITTKQYDVIFLATKAYDVNNVIKVLTKSTKVPNFNLIISLQNGIGSLESLKEVFPLKNVAAGVVTYGLYRVSYTTYLQSEGEIVLGQSNKLENELLIDIKNLLSKGGLNTKLVDDIEPYRWFKLLINVAINPLTIIYQGSNGIILEIPEAYEISLAIINEGLKVLDRLNIKLPMDPIQNFVELVKKTKDNYSSMLQDFLQGKEVEIDYMNGIIVRKGKELGVPTPVNNLIIKIVKGLVRWRKLQYQI